MATVHSIETVHAVHQAAAHLVALEWLNQETAQQIGPLAEAVANAFMVVFYQAETGQATRDDFRETLEAIHQYLPQV